MTRTTREPDVPEAAEALQARLGSSPRTLIVLGSGLGSIVDRMTDVVEVPFEELPGLEPTGVPGHAGRFVGGRLEGTEVLIQAGRYHVYEGRPLGMVVAPVRIAAAIGVETLVVTNAAGALVPSLRPGDLVLIEDHINFMSRNPLEGAVRPGEQRFPDMSEPYDAELRRLALESAGAIGVRLREGVYVGVLGPSFETAAEVRMFALLGGHVVGMSTVPEVLTARALGLRCLGFSMVANLATGLGSGPIAHEEVLRVGSDAGRDLGRLLGEILGASGRGYGADTK